MKPNLFIGSSVEGLNVAQAIELVLRHKFNVTLWSNGVFNISSTTLEDLLVQLDKSDFAIFIFSPDDTAVIRKTEYTVARDNVIYELGLYTGKLGRKNTFIVVPSSLPKDFHRPSDLSGIYIETYDDTRLDNLQSAVSPFCSLVSQQIFNTIKYPLNGKWIFTWEALDSETYPKPIIEEVEVFHFESKVKFLHTISTSEKYNVEAEFQNHLLTGSFKNTSKIGYDGVFQMKVNGKGDSFEGLWTGWKINGTIGSGPCSLKKV
jgi:hypothetical protein